MRAAILLCVATCTVAWSKTWKSAVLTDVHININYVPNITADTYCELKPANTQYTKDISYFGRLGCDPPPALLERFLQRINQTEPDLDLLFMPGDFIGHSIPISAKDPFNPENYAKLKDVHSLISNMIAKYLPKTLVVPAFGNNDWIFHY